MNSIPKVLIFFFKQHVLRIFLHDYYNILYNLLIQVRERKTTFSTSNDRILLYFAGTRRRKRRREDCNRRCRATKRFRLQSWSTCRYCRKSSIFYATWYVNIPFILNTRSSWNIRFFSSQLQKSLWKIVRWIRQVQFDRGWCTRVGVAIERGTERRNRTRRLCKSSVAARRMLCNQRFLPHCAYFQFAQFQFHSWVYTIFVINFHIFFHLDVDSNV